MNFFDNINSKKDMYDIFEDRIVKNTDKYRDTHRVKNPYLKTYLIENNCVDLEKISNINIGKNINLDIVPIVKDIYGLSVSKKNNITDFYIEKTSDRFLRIHTLDKTEFTDKIINSLITSEVNLLDFSWFSNSFLREFKENSNFNFKGFTLKHKNYFASKDKGSEVSMRLWGNDAQRIVNILDDSSFLSRSVSLSTITLSRLSEENLYLEEDVSYNGKFSVRGNNIQDHIGILNLAENNYINKLNLIEKNWIKYDVSDFNFSIKGNSFTFLFNKKPENLHLFCKSIFQSKKPFRLWGLIKKENIDHYVVESVDLHTGDPLTFEFTNKWVRVYLPEGSCGNIIMRFMTNIQIYFDSNFDFTNKFKNDFYG